MSNSETKQQYEGAILNQLIENAQKLAIIEFEFNRVKPKIEKIEVLEQKIDKIYSGLSTLKWISVTIGIGVVINIFSQPILSRLF